MARDRWSSDLGIEVWSRDRWSSDLGIEVWSGRTTVFP